MPLPLYSMLAKNYPTNHNTIEVLKKVGGGAIGLPNSCVIRVSQALNYAGEIHKIKKSHIMDTVTGADGLLYGKKVMEFKDYLNHYYKSTPRVAVRSPVKMNPNQFKLKKGIIGFFIDGWDNARGHFTLWDGFRLAYEGDHNYWSEFHKGYIRGQVCIEEICLWECPY